MRYYVYILASEKNGTLYIGVTGNLIQRVFQHKECQIDGFTKQYGINKLVWYEGVDNIMSAITREKQMKKWKREWKMKLIEQDNPSWTDLIDSLF